MYVTSDRLNNTSFGQKLNPIAKNIYRREPLELVFKDISTFDAQNPIIGSLFGEIDVGKKDTSKLLKKAPNIKEVEIQSRLEALKRRNDDGDNNIFPPPPPTNFPPPTTNFSPPTNYPSPPLLNFLPPPEIPPTLFESLPSPPPLFPTTPKFNLPTNDIQLTIGRTTKFGVVEAAKSEQELPKNDVKN